MYRAISRGAATLASGVVIVGIIAAVAFEPLFELFHRLFFAGGSYTFDPATERLVQLFPFTFWQETTIAVGIVIVLLATATWWVAGRRAPPTIEARRPNPAVTA
jgi:integral membrane protein (TIGR01906 family)